MKGVLRLGLIGAAYLSCGNVSPDQIGQRGQGIVTHTPGKVLEFIWDSKLPQISPEQPLILRRIGTCMVSRITRNKKLVGTLGCEHNRGSEAPYNLIRRESCA